MVMTLALLVYSVAQRRLRKQLLDLKVFSGSSQGAQLEVYTLHSPLDAIQQR
jgi:hypothetical protein